MLRPCRYFAVFLTSKGPICGQKYGKITAKVRRSCLPSFSGYFCRIFCRFIAVKLPCPERRNDGKNTLSQFIRGQAQARPQTTRRRRRALSKSKTQLLGRFAPESARKRNRFQLPQRAGSRNQFPVMPPQFLGLRMICTCLHLVTLGCRSFCNKHNAGFRLVEYYSGDLSTLREHGITHQNVP